MMTDTETLFSRSRLLLGDRVMERLASARVIIFGMGGVGSWVAETLVRTGLRCLTIVDFDSVAPSNINRQLPALTTTIGLPKVEVMRNHLLQINPEAEISAVNRPYNALTAPDFDLNGYDFVVDAIDSVADKALLILNATAAQCRFCSSMGAALKTDPLQLRVSDFWKVSGCRLAAALRNRFRRTGLYPSRKFKVVWSPELRENRLSPAPDDSAAQVRRGPNGSLMQVTATAGITLASLIINDLLDRDSR